MFGAKKISREKHIYLFDKIQLNISFEEYFKGEVGWMTKKNLCRLIVSLLIPQLVGLAGAFFTSTSVSTWYESLSKPFYAPPNWVFGPVWVVLYFLMGVAFYLVWSKGLENENVKEAVNYWIIQLAFNLLWTIGFFGFQSALLGLIVIILLWGAVYWTTRKFFPISETAGWLMVPYLLWVSFALLLNLSIFLLNL